MTGMRKIDPALALTTFGLYGSTEPGVSTTASAPAASADRMIVPALPGSDNRSATSTNEASSGNVAARIATIATTGWARLNLARLRAAGDTLEHVWGQVVLHDIEVDVRVGRAVTTLDLPSGGDRLAQQPEALDNEHTVLVTRTATPQEASQSLNPRVRVGEQFAQRAAFAAVVKAANAAASVTARSASILRSTSMPAAFNPAMKRL